jgi:NADP-reducing hydrogenase subunit HndB
MAKIKSVTDLGKIKDKTLEILNDSNTIRIKIAMATCCVASGSKETWDYIVNELEKRNIEASVTQTGCMGYCYAEPTVEVTLPGKEPVVFGYVDAKKADKIIEKFIKEGEYVDGIIPQNYQNI